MLNLFIDTTTDFLILILEKEQKIIGQVHQNHARRHTETTLPTIIQLLGKHQLKLKDINNFYLSTGPGSYTGVRIPITIVKTVKIINSAINVYAINTLLYQAGLENIISTLDARNGKLYFAVISNGVELVPRQVIDYKNCIEIKKQFPGYEFRYDLQEIDFVKNYIVLKNNFTLIEDIFALEPQYLKEDWS